jgi:surfactin family lipopeptide synthetase A
MLKKRISYILPFSAKSREALDHTSSQVIRYLKEHDQIDLADASWTLQKGRRAFEYRKALVTSRNDMESDTFHVCSNAASTGKVKQNLVFVLPSVQDANDIWKKEGTEGSAYHVLKIYERAAEQILQMLPAETAENVRAGISADQEVNLYRAFISGYASVMMLMELGVQPTALAGEGIAELGAFVCAGAVSIKDAINIIQKHGPLSTYEEVYEKYDVRKKLIPIIRKAGKKAKQHIDDALVIKLGSAQLENSITGRCMTDVSDENVICLIENPADEYIQNVYQLIGKLWCKGIRIDWSKISGDPSLKRIALPTYVFDKKEFDSDVLFGGRHFSTDNKPADSVPENDEAVLDPSEVLSKLWKEALGMTEIKKEDDFFEKGGDSLGAIMLSSKIKESLKVHFPMSELFHHSTFGKMEKYIHAHLNQKSEDVIEKLGVQEYYEASSAQKRMYAVNELIEDAIPYNFAAVYKVKGKIDKEKIQNCFSKIVQRHESFRTRFNLVDGEVVQIIEDNVDFKVEFQRIANENLNEAIQEHIKPFDLGKAPLLRVASISLNEEEHVMVLDMHHIIADQSSLDVLLKEIGQIYQGEELPELEIQYKDFAKWQNDFFRSGKMKKQLEFWKKEFEGGIPVLDMYTDYDRPEVMGFEGGKVHFAFENDISDRILAFAKEQGITPYMFMMAALNIMLWKYTNQKEIVIGTPIAGRRHSKLESLVGMFVNTLVIKSELDGNAAIKDYLQYTKEKLVSTYDNQDCQFDMLVEELGVPKNLSRNPLFDILFNYINIGTDEVEIEGLSLEPYDDGKIDVKFDISFTLAEKNQKLDERQWLVDTVNQTATDYPADKTALTIFEKCVRDHPDATAIEWMEEKISYKQLNNMANQLAKKLTERNIGYQDTVAILLERGYMQMVSMLGIMKLGAVYVPIDPKYPQERMDYILEDCRSKVVVTDYSMVEKVSSEIEKFLIDEEENKLDRDFETGIESDYTPEAFHSEDLIYMIYTSGSTGKPKGTLIKHKNVVRVVKNTNYIEISKKDRIMQISNYVFDCSVFDIYSALLNGACLVIIPRETSLDIPLLADFINEKEISAFCISTALFHLLVDWKAESLKDVRTIIVAGEQLSLPHAQKAVDAIGKGKLINAYGPTESAVFATYYPVDEIEDVSIVPIGYPLANTTVYVVDEKKQLVPINVAGELCLGGDGIGRGYLNRDDLTEEKFITLDAAGGKRVYCTGDRVMWNSRRELVFLGRMDFQIKLRGFRVELGEVERHINSIDGIKNVVITADKDHLGTLYMTAYYTIKDDRQKDQYDEDYLRNALSSKLPEYMIPSKYMLLEEFPLNFSGKVDRKALPKVKDQGKKVSVKDEPGTPLERVILEAMQKILDVADLGIKDNFFHFGGQSIKAIALVRELSNKGVEIKVNEIFQYQTAEKMAASVEPMAEDLLPLKETENTVTDVMLTEKQMNGLVRFITSGIEGVSDMITVSETGAEFPLSPIQKGHMSKGSDHSGFITNVYALVSENRIKDAIVKVICKNQLLHCTLVEADGEQKWCEYEVDEIEGVIGNYLTYADISMYAESVKEKIISRLCDEILLRKYSEDELLWRMCVLKESANKHVVIWGADHLIFDGMSAEIIKHQIEKELGKGTKDETQPIRSYKEYIEVLEQGPEGITEEELIDKFHLEKWSQFNSKVMEVPLENPAQLKRNVELVIPLTEVDQADIWWYAFDFVSDILRDYKKTETIPFAFLDYARSYQGKDFYNTVGEFLDIVPVISSKEEKIYVESVIEMCRDHSVNFLTLLGEERFRKAYPKLNEKIGKYYYNDKEYFDFILYNFQGFVQTEEKKAFAHNNKDNSLARMYVTVNYDNDHLYIELEDAAGLNEAQLRKYAEERKKFWEVLQ